MNVRRRIRVGLSHTMGFLASRLLFWMLRGSTLRTAARVGMVAGRILWAVAARERSRAVASLATAYPDRHPRWRRRIGKRCFERLGVTGGLTIQIGFVDQHLIDSVVDYEEWAEQVALSPGLGIIALSSHAGPFLASAGGCAKCGPFDLVARPARLAYLEKMEQQFFRNIGCEAFVQGRGLRQMVRRVRDGVSFGMVPDHDVKRIGGVFVPYFGRLAFTPSGPVALARLSGCRLTTALTIPNSESTRYRPRYTLRVTPIPLQDSGDRDVDLCENTRRWLAVMESYVRLNPEEWTWMNRRWRTRPEDRPHVTVWRPEFNRDGWEPPPARPA